MRYRVIKTYVDLLCWENDIVLMKTTSYIDATEKASLMNDGCIYKVQEKNGIFSWKLREAYQYKKRIDRCDCRTI